jgi:hypothetical protein
VIDTISIPDLKEVEVPLLADLATQENNDSTVEADSQQPTPIIEKGEETTTLIETPIVNGETVEPKSLEATAVQTVTKHMRDFSISSNR